MTGAADIFARAPEGYASHALHGPDRNFRETNCYVDVWIEVLHALELEPRACLGFTLASDYEGDQWTFFKPPHGDLDRLYGVRVEELILWRPLLEHAQTQVARGHLPLVEEDSFFLPDTAGTDYRQGHVKTTVAITAVDPERHRLHYFHNTGFHALEGEDFEGVFRPGPSSRPDYLPPYCEIIKPDRAELLPPDELRARSLALARHHFARRPAKNPLRAHAARLDRDVALIAQEGNRTYHAYSFAVVRQLGANFELLASYLRWLDPAAEGPVAETAEAFEGIAATAKMVILKLARTANSGRAVDLSARFEDMARSWDEGMDRLAVLLAP